MKNKKIIFSIITVCLVICGFAAFLLYENWAREKSILTTLRNNKNFIYKCCSENNLKPRLYASIIYGEINSNLNFFDEFDNIRAVYGFDPSVGFGQMKVSTFMWIEEKYAGCIGISKSKNRDELIRKIIDTKTNISYSALYIALIRKKIIESTGTEPKVKDVATYYSLGIDHGGQKINLNNTTPVGLEAEKFYYSDKLADIFPK